VVAISYSLQSNGCGQTKKERDNMSKNLTRKGLAFGAGIALVATGLAAMPAQAAAGDINLSPDDGTLFSVFNGDTFPLDATTSSLVPAAVYGALAYRIENPDQHTLAFTLPVMAADAADTTAQAAAETVRVIGFTSIGTIGLSDRAFDLVVDISAAGAGGDPVAGTDTSGSFQIDFAANNITSLVIHTIGDESAAHELDIDVVRDVSAGDAGTRALVNSEFAALDRLDYSEGDASITVQAYAEVDSKLSTVDAGFASDVETINWYDPATVAVIPKIERFDNEADALTVNDVSENTLGATLQFGKAVNLDLITLDDYNFEIVVDNPDAAANTATKLFYGSANNDLSHFAVHPSEVANGDFDGASKLFFEFLGVVGVLDNSHQTINGTKVEANGGATVGDPNKIAFAMVVGNAYTFSVNRFENDGTTETRDISSPSFAIPANTTVAAGIEAIVTTDDVSAQADSADAAFDLKAGSKAVTYTAQLSDNNTPDAGDAEAEASTPVLVAVKATSYIDGEYVVSGTPTKLTELNQTVFVTGFTDSDGQYSVTVTSSTASKSEAYVVKFYYLDASTWTDGQTYTATYNTSAPTEFTTPLTVLGGESVTVGFEVEDQFAAATDVNGTTPMSVILQGSDTDNLEEIVAVNGGAASFTFDNYLNAGESDIITATLVTGTLTTNTQVLTPLTLTLYNTGDVVSINVPDTYTGAITHADFVDGKVSATNPAPGAATATIVTTLVDANGSGIPGAVATISGDNMNFKQVGATTYFLDTITVVADAAGVINVEVWTHKVTGADGANVTITSGDQTETVEIESYFPQAMKGEILDFKISVPAQLEANKTYAVEASLMDKWGNPVATSAGAVDIAGNGSVLVNNVAAGVTKNFGSTGTVTVFLRSVTDILGPGSVSATLQAGADYAAWNGTAVVTTETLLVAEQLTDVTTTVWDETVFANEVEVDIEVVTEITTSADQKVNVGTFKGFVALYAKGYEGQKMSAIVAGKWIVVESLASDFERVVRFTGAGYTITTKLYIDGVQVGDDFTTLTK
jgi:hypothetical protein